MILQLTTLPCGAGTWITVLRHYFNTALRYCYETGNLGGVIRLDTGAV